VRVCAMTTPFAMTYLVLAAALFTACGGVTSSPAPGEPDASHARDAGKNAAKDSSATKPDAPAPDGGCRTSADCSGEFEGCSGDYGGGCICDNGPSCTTDSECDAGRVCDYARDNSSCLPDGGLSCTSPCTIAEDCFIWQSCTDGGHCQARSCAECPSYLSCPAGGTCEAMSCASDADCPGGYCVNGSCQGTLGTCQQECA
jgi:hypothetical protein